MDLTKKTVLVTGDIRDPHFVKKIATNSDMIFNLAALIAIPYSYVAPDSYVDTNIKGTLNVCQAAMELGDTRPTRDLNYAGYLPGIYNV